jgi:mono/diheme cytochrome c family protein
MRRFLLLGVAAVLAGAALADPPFSQPAGGKKSATRTVQYARDIQPILSGNCFACHGPDVKTRKAGLRLDIPELARKTLKSGARAIVPGDAKNSELVARIFATDSERMPPKNSHKKLKEAEKQLLKRWIEEGAEYQPHWAFIAPQRPAVPVTETKGWARNAIDHFILARLEKEGLKPAPDADRYALARRAALDLTGLPPTLDAVDRFVNDASPEAYEKYVDQLLASPAYGERWAQVWLDLARYADSNGYADDRPRTIWKYRDWVIDALNANMPFDRFTVEQIAGDLLPNPTQAQLLATAFHRNTLTNDEGGTDDEEFRTAAVVDRVNTTMQVWMGLTMACAQCHDHKYDPISQEEYFRFYAILNQTEDSDKPDNRPVLATPTPEQEKQKAKLQAEIAAVEKKVSALDMKALQQRWEAEARRDKVPQNVRKILEVEKAKRSTAQHAELTKFFRSISPEYKQANDRLVALRKQLAAVPVVTTPIMRELPEKQRRKTRIHIRGNFLNPGKEVTPGVPAVFHPLPQGRPADRMALARWLVDPANPLTARVAVNRYWEQVFGVGLVENSEDYGIRGKPPVHPELLDWLATEFIALKWDSKKLLKLMVTSAAYRQSSRVTPALVERDPDNRLFARGPRFRSAAEVIRDQALFVSGLLSPKMGGPPVRPPRPKLKLNAAFGGATDWETSPGEDKVRRALYTFWRRTTPYPSMVTFDAPGRNVCAVNRPRTNTPLQALVTLNDPVYVEAAQALARRLVREGGPTVADRALHGFRLCLARPPRPEELRRLTDLYEKARAKYAASPKEAEQLATQPIGPLPPGMDAVEVAAWTVVGNVMLNLDEMFARR